MRRRFRCASGGFVYHVLNRAVARATLFDKSTDYLAFEKVLSQARDFVSVRSFPIQDDDHLLTVCRYVERNALRVGLVPRAEAWPWSRLRRRLDRNGPVLDPGPIPLPTGWVEHVNRPQTNAELDASRRCLARAHPMGQKPGRKKQPRSWDCKRPCVPAAGRAAKHRHSRPK